ncbi:hypothetical protein BGX26_011348 [Mortierella sp. AD094]|nr:hypothetical protein BGX26_011348 [Mortierella sp. AD094]
MEDIAIAMEQNEGDEGEGLDKPVNFKDPHLLPKLSLDLYLSGKWRKIPRPAADHQLENEGQVEEGPDPDDGGDFSIKQYANVHGGLDYQKRDLLL